MKKTIILAVIGVILFVSACSTTQREHRDNAYTKPSTMAIVLDSASVVGSAFDGYVATSAIMVEQQKAFMAAYPECGTEYGREFLLCVNEIDFREGRITKEQAQKNADKISAPRANMDEVIKGGQ